ERLDERGWRPGFEGSADGARDPGLTRAVREFFAPALDDFAVRPEAEAATRELLGLCRGRGVAVALAYLPEPATFRSGDAPAARAEVVGRVGRRRGEDPLDWVDASAWLDDGCLPDEFHLNGRGAAAFTRLLADRVLPGLTGGRGREP